MMRSSVVCGAALAGFLVFSSSAHAQTCPAVADTDCEELPNPVFIKTGDTQEPLMKNLGRQLADSGAQEMTVVYITDGSCPNIGDFYEGTLITANMKYAPSSVVFDGWTPAMPSCECNTIDGGQALDIAVSALFTEACEEGADGPPAGIALFQGPVQAYVMAVPEDSTQDAITAEEAYFVFGFGIDGMAEPWTENNDLIHIRLPTKSTIITWAKAIGVEAADWFGIPYDKSGDLVADLVVADPAEAAIGILGVEVYDRFRADLNVLAYQAYDQFHAYYPDSTREGTDRQNVRDGHYTVWSPTVYIAEVDGEGVPTSANAGIFIDLVLGNTVMPDPGFVSLETVIAQGLVPDCAMQVTRSFEGGPLSLYTPEEPCGCFFDSVVDETDCAECDDDEECGGDRICKYGYCEGGA